MWWFFRRLKKPPKDHLLRKIIVGLIIGGAIGSIVGRKLVDKHSRRYPEDEEDARE
jgi:uncharacterized membrane protein YfcA